MVPWWFSVDPYPVDAPLNGLIILLRGVGGLPPNAKTVASLPFLLRKAYPQNNILK